MPRGQTAHLEGKRTGRPKGTGHRSRLLHDMRWAYETIGEPEARPPTAGAKYCKDWILRDPTSFLALLGTLEGEGGPARESVTTANKSEKKAPQNVRKVFVHAQHLRSRLTANNTSFLSNLPHDAYIIGVEADPSRDGFLFTIHSNKFFPVESGKVIPEMEAEWSHGPLHMD